jgi:hypothetical protein
MPQYKDYSVTKDTKLRVLQRKCPGCGYWFDFNEVAWAGNSICFKNHSKTECPLEIAKAAWLKSLDEKMNSVENSEQPEEEQIEQIAKLIIL